MIVLDGVTKVFGSRVVLHDLSLTLAPGSVTAVLGVNGSGKTTLGRLVLGLEVPSAGTITRPAQCRGSAVFQEDRLVTHLSAVRNVRLVLGRTWCDESVADELVALGLPAQSLHVPVRTLSGGQRRKVALVRAVLASADVLVLDEPFTSLDTDAKTLAEAWLRDRLDGQATMLITHDVSQAQTFGADVLRLPAPPADPDL
ncbi:MAG: ATP-binding cassette domain-containing protein [Micrococcales bacterium]|nr:ATP-binding cassette domain-containing protein [Micrococcales bacterium]MCL2667701.1 ATP-binding cassette domain-containing protein [Micrococcales bacterium]